MYLSQVKLPDTRKTNKRSLYVTLNMGCFQLVFQKRSTLSVKSYCQIRIVITTSEPIHFFYRKNVVEWRCKNDARVTPPVFINRALFKSVNLPGHLMSQPWQPTMSQYFTNKRSCVRVNCVAVVYRKGLAGHVDSQMEILNAAKPVHVHTA